MEDIYAAREIEFGETYEDLEAAEVVNLIVATGEWLEKLLLDHLTVDQAMKALLLAVMEPDNVSKDASWRELWGDLRGHEHELRFAQYMVSLNAFAFFGLSPDKSILSFVLDGETLSAEKLTAFVQIGRDLVDAVPPGWASLRDTIHTVTAAEARLRLDTGRPLTIEHLAAIARVNTKSIRNMLTPKGSKPDLFLNDAGEMPSADALRWLSRRPDFRASLWQEAVAGHSFNTLAESADITDPVFVPVAKDGSRFDPITCRRAGAYTIGTKGEETRVEDFRDALQLLARMRTPRWRRPNEKGDWGIVTGTSWLRLAANDLDLDERAP